MPESLPIRNKPRCDRADATAILLRLREAGHVAYFAGGCVRDLLLGHDPQDYDIATDAPPERVRQLFNNTQAVGAAFGVILVRLGGSVVEVATFRADESYEDGRRPTAVRFTTAQEDAQRRDFTINGLFLDPMNDQVIDYVGGRKDLEARTLRAIGNPLERFGEDHLRLLRAVRFAARFGLEIEPATAAAIEKTATWLARISPERIADELRISLTAPSRAVAWPMMWRFGLAPVVLRFLQQKNLRFDGARSILLATAPGEPIEFGLALAAIALCAMYQADGFGGEITALLDRKTISQMEQALRQALKISNDESADMIGALEGAGMVLRDAAITLAVKKRFLARPTSHFSRQLMRALAGLGMHAAQIAGLEREFLELEKTEFAPLPLITGDDLVAAGLSPGPVFRRVLENVYDAQLEARVTTRDQAMEMAMKLAAETSGG